MLRQIGPVRLRQGHNGMHLNGLTRLHQIRLTQDVHHVLFSLEAAHVDFDILRSDFSVAVKVILDCILFGQRLGIGLIGNRQQSLRILYVRFSVAVQVIDVSHSSVGGKGHLRHQAIGGIGHVILPIHRLHRHGVDAGTEGVVCRLLGKVVDSEVKGIHAGALRIISQVDLGLAIGGRLAICQQIGRGSHRRVNIGQAGALLSGRVLHIPLLHQRNSGRQQQRLAQSADGQALLPVQTLLLHVLGHHRRHTGNAGGRHGGTGHVAIGPIVQGGPDVTTGSGDLRLQVQIAGNTPGGKAAGKVAAGGVLNGLDLVGNDHFATPQSILPLLGGSQDHITVGFVQHDRRILVIVAGHVHVQRAGGIVVHHRGDGPGLHSPVGFLKEGHTTAPGDEHHLSGEVQPGEVLFRAINMGTGYRIAQKHIVVLRPGMVLCGVQGPKSPHTIVIVGVGVSRSHAIKHWHHTGQARIIHRGHRECIAEGAGRAYGVDDRISCQLHFKPCGVILRKAVLITSRNGHHGIGIYQTGKEGVIVAVGMTSRRRAQRQVHCVTVQQNCVLNGRHVVRVICAATPAEHLHGQQLGVGRNAHHTVGLPGSHHISVGILRPHIGVGRGNAGDVGTMVALAVVIVGHIQILVYVVKGEGNLGRAVEVPCGEAGIELCRVELRQNLRHLLRRQQIVVRHILAKPGG